MKTDYWHNYEEEVVYHVYNWSSHMKNLFIGEDDYLFFLSGFQKYLIPFFETFAYCLMPNHFHFLIQVKKESEIIRYVEKNLDTKKGLEYTQGKCNLTDIISD